MMQYLGPPVRQPDGSWALGPGQLVPLDVTGMWTEHSPRATLPSGLAALGVQARQRQLLGRWQLEPGEEYVRSYRATVAGMQADFAQAARAPEAWRLLDEGTLENDIKFYLLEKRGLPGEEAAARAALCVRGLQLATRQLAHDLAPEEAPTEVATPTHEADMEEEGPAESLEVPTVLPPGTHCRSVPSSRRRGEDSVHLRPMHPTPVDGPRRSQAEVPDEADPESEPVALTRSAFVIAYTRGRKMARLHRARGGCRWGRQPGLVD